MESDCKRTIRTPYLVAEIVITDNLESMDQDKKPVKGLVMVYTGHGKGKTTAALGTIFRAIGHGLRVCVIQFIKNKQGQWGEVKMARQLNIEWHTFGDGFTWQSKDTSETIARACETWALAQEKIASGEFDLILLDEFTYPLIYHWLDTTTVVDWLRQHKPPSQHLIITGRDAPPELISYADLVTEMGSLKHPFDQGVKAQKGIEY